MFGDLVFSGNGIWSSVVRGFGSCGREFGLAALVGRVWGRVAVVLGQGLGVKTGARAWTS